MVFQWYLYKLRRPLSSKLINALSRMTLAMPKNPAPSLSLLSGREISLTPTVIMGVLNVTPDSFSDGANFVEPARAIERGLEMISEGAGIIDIGGESSRPGAEPVPVDEEIRRVAPVIKGIRNKSDVPISIDTCKAATAEAALEDGADMVNDISALRFDENMVKLLVSRPVPVILMHMLGTPATMQKQPQYDDCVAEIADFFEERLDFCSRHGIASERIVLDPGIGFGKRLTDNVSILSRFAELKRFNRPLLVGTSRKSFIDLMHPDGSPADQRLGGSIASMLMAVANGADIVRVHDVAQTAQALSVFRAIKEGS